ncbi:ATP-dependent Clp protease ATP-binding subunit [Geomicrobium sp. JCM 19039]|uniref:ATP-dependent Clp protease ATP-binding subunit n=1 Tax=Geomicrobium sp. JCM 19039 TaxID=1460636 RepID=UPI0005A68CFA|nr:ATP-dependent Clp protease ATP-binding subunit [Geomicrobium sp. JCM 19039]
MRCDHCQTNQARVQLRMNINGNQRKMSLCQSCYQDLRNQMHQPSGQGASPMNFMNGDTTNHHVRAEATDEKQGGGLLDELGKNLTTDALNGQIDPVIGRDHEVERVIETLNRRNKNNPVLIGEPGVGKTAIAEGLALRIVNEDVPKKLKNKQIYLLDVTSLVAGTGVRGQFEERMKQLIQEMKMRDDVILFIDEIHQIVGAGSAEGSSDAGNILKPALARGEMQLIGATTLNEYRKIEKDAALERRFQPVIVDEPTREDSLKILNGLKPYYEKYHEVTYTPEAIEATVMLSDRYIQDRFLPDKAIDLMDESGAKMNLKTSELSTDDITERLEDIRKEKEQATSDENYERAAELRTEELQLIDKQQSKAEGIRQQAVVDIEDIQQLIEAKTGIPVRRLQADEQQKMRDLPDRLNANVIGQDQAVSKVSKAIRRNRAGLRRGTRPIGSFLFAGPTGVGKTELTKQIAVELFGEKDAMIRFDMSEYMEKHAASKLIGSPPGYVGYEEAGQLTERVRRKPYSIILLDEIEKAHPDIQHMFLQIMEDGRLTDSKGRTVSFKDTVIIMTTNAGTGVKTPTVGFGADDVKGDEQLINGLKDYFKPEFLNRFDAIVQFNDLQKKDLVSIVDLMLEDVIASASEQGIRIEVMKEAKEKIVNIGYDPAFGARPLRRVIEEYVEDGIADLMLNTEDYSQLVVTVEDDRVIVNTK